MHSRSRPPASSGLRHSRSCGRAIPREGAIDLLFFLLPFALLLALVAQTVLSGAISRALAVVLLAEAVVVAGIGLWQEWTHTLFFADDLQLANSYTSFFRVTSIFKDSSIYGRFLVLAIVVLVVLLWLDRLRAAYGLPLLGFLLVGLYFSYSQTSFLALFAAVLVIGLVAATGSHAACSPRRRRRSCSPRSASCSPLPRTSPCAG